MLDWDGIWSICLLVQEYSVGVRMEGFEGVVGDREAWLSEAGYANGFLFEVFYCADLSVLFPIPGCMCGAVAL